ncbi:unnamed protein product [Trichogramma brassicae]|uniref:Uncharacterized protein n=1 Tax=Trichogramma brassicae TaxID=86971 RepID=A0A6H5IAJ4_9HYME|nr:unnamed protein product [Trichogramma brassicae]
MRGARLATTHSPCTVCTTSIYVVLLLHRSERTGTVGARESSREPSRLPSLLVLVVLLLLPRGAPESSQPAKPRRRREIGVVQHIHISVFSKLQE